MPANNRENYYVPAQSKLAVCASLSMLLLAFGAASSLNMAHYQQQQSYLSLAILAVGLVALIATLSYWFNTVIIENQQGLNNRQLKRSYILAMQWFIFSEVMFFAAFFGSLLYIRQFALPWLAGEASGSANSLIWHNFNNHWPLFTTPQQAVGIENQVLSQTQSFNGPNAIIKWQHIPLINTSILLTSSLFVHLAHGFLKQNKKPLFNLCLFIALTLGLVFVSLQILEYKHAYQDLGLTLNAGIYGSSFFILTGFHGLHVCIGTIMLIIQWLRSSSAGHFSANDHFGFEASAWYWHFVDVVWLVLFLFVYIL